MFFDNVGGATLEAALNRLARRRADRALRRGVAVQRHPAGTGQLHAVAGRARIHDWLCHLRLRQRYPEGIAQLAKWLNTGELRSHEQIEHGDVGDFPDALLRLFRGENTGKLILARGIASAAPRVEPRMKAFTETERQEFLAAKHVAVLSVGRRRPAAGQCPDVVRLHAWREHPDQYRRGRRASPNSSSGRAR